MENKYDIIIEYIKSEIQTGLFKSKLPSIRALAIKFNCSNSTVIRAYSELEKQNIIYSVPKSGYFVTENKIFSNNSLESKFMDFSSGEPNINILPFEDFQNYINKSINKYKQSIFGYGNYSGFPPLKHTLVDLFSKDGLTAKEDNLTICSGGEQALTSISLLPFPNGKTDILIENPTYNMYLAWLKVNNSSIHTIERDENGIDLAELERIFKEHKIKFFYTIPRLHNPLGYSYNEEQKKRILELANKYDVYIVEDDYVSVLNDKTDYPLFFYDKNDRVIYVRSFSKIFLPGVRLAAIHIPSALNEPYLEYKRFLDLQPSIFVQSAFDEFIKDGAFDSYAISLKKHYASKLSILDKSLKECNINELEYYIPSNGLFGYFKINKTINKDELENMLYANKVLIRETTYFNFDRTNKNNLFRLSVSKIEENSIEKGINIVISSLNELLNKSTNKANKFLQI